MNTENRSIKKAENFFGRYNFLYILAKVNLGGG